MSCTCASTSCHACSFATGKVASHCPRPTSMYVNSGSRRNSVSHCGHAWRWNEPSRMAARRSGRRSAFTLTTALKLTVLPHDGHGSGTTLNIDMGHRLHIEEEVL